MVLFCIIGITGKVLVKGIFQMFFVFFNVVV